MITGMLPAQRTPTMDSYTQPALRGATILLVDPDRATREPLQTSLMDVGVGAVLQAGSLSAVNELIARGETGDLALVSLANGADSARIISTLQRSGWTRVLALAPTADIGPVIDAVGAGVNGVLIGRRANPAAANIPHTIHDLSSREIEVIRLVADGRSNKWIGDQLSLSALTVKSHLARIGRKLGTGDRAHMVALAMRAGVIS
ncbi:DNA-binding response regulator [Nakamurella sp. YIM 132087]|uniref:DNA-binding response regulator n=2 Tax=Nakamurella alba TaxID=2665158 RepID=A0A7K1FQJ6_9ACTN|nr:DNA-binding response regulator [Nakamurella alba]